MSRRVSLPGADELFRTTGGTALQASAPKRQAGGEARVPAPAGESDSAASGDHPSDSARAEGGSAEHATAEGGQTGAASREASHTEEGEARSGRRKQDKGAEEGESGSGGRRRQGGRAAARRPSGRERHDEKITVYVSAEELMDLEHARLVLRGEHGLAVDRGRIVREAVAVVLADLESRGEASILVRRLRGR
ncbi:hypothetical protein SLNWT_6108 [Streptomyces albus]|uniref:Uncharacterized protein n=1 Tax=Streptomyces albus (strain ATCC 21838 / DSM 41398 / FERM P-419 / JCM 4703 / NBRC 107858) TaxID=1081613 RepID=A0A0B5EXE2_STRA4|nr:hypothetical protein SLNWT_6108 [Streptomyces albus]AOU80787.1 hypothetical protein SLNHY_6096 [Streptomyces albus]AYN36493.1 hypothetical protein DUI70_5999 [Streptomyces albus]